MVWLVPAWTPVAAQQPTGNIPTVTGTPPWHPLITVNNPDGANVRAGPSSYDYAADLDFLPNLATAPAIGKSPVGRMDSNYRFECSWGSGLGIRTLGILSPGISSHC